MQFPTSQQMWDSSGSVFCARRGRYQQRRSVRFCDACGEWQHRYSRYSVRRASQRQLLLEQKYFDGMTDCHIMLVSINGSGDFTANAEIDGNQSIPMLSLVRVYGKVTGYKNAMPVVETEYIRVWPWFTFTLTDLGPEDHGNSKWRKLCRICKSGDLYNPYPTEEWYLSVLGDPAKAACNNRRVQQKRISFTARGFKADPPLQLHSLCSLKPIVSFHSPVQMAKVIKRFNSIPIKP